MEEQKDLGSYSEDGPAAAVSVPSTVWQDISTAPKDGNSPVKLRSAKYAPDEAFIWNKQSKRWECRIFAAARSKLGWWGASEQPAQWRPA